MYKILCTSLLIALSLMGFASNKGKVLHAKHLRVIVSESDDRTVQFAARELANYWKKMTGITLSVNGSGNERGFHLLLDKQNKEIRWDGYRLTIHKNGVTIKAKEPRGILYGVYDFLQRQGCGFFYPDPAQEIIPRIEKMNYLDELVNPRLEWRGMALYGVRDDQIEITGRVIDWMAKQRYNYVLLSQDRPAGAAGLAQEVFFTGESERVLLPELIKRDFIINMGEHNTHCYLDKDKLFKIHPEWFAEINGKRTRGQICYSNHDAMIYYSKQLIKWLKDKPWVDIVGTWPLDGGGYCTCKNCQNPETVVNAINTLAKEIKKVYPNKIVEYLSYKDATFVVPKAPLCDNMNILYCPDLGVRSQLEKDWVKAAKNAQGVCKFEYYMADHWRARGMVWLRPDDAIEKANYMAENHFRGAASLYLGLQTWWRGSFNYYFFGKALWENNLKVEPMLMAHCKQYYGKYTQKVFHLYNQTLYHMQEGGYFDMTSKDRKMVLERCEKLNKRSQVLLKEVNKLADAVDEKAIRNRIRSLGYYVENVKLQTTYVLESTDANFNRLLAFAKKHTQAADGSSIQDDYLKWRMGWMPKNLPDNNRAFKEDVRLKADGLNTIKVNVGQQIRSNGKWIVTVEGRGVKLKSAGLLEDNRMVSQATINDNVATIELTHFFDMGKYDLSLKVQGPQGGKCSISMRKK
ncbi:DUF4838 domain-containing protein [Prolixibacteraceae bacterium JC049]|nr:DUF4838 domain-containing protein [Prolixibacteraceae bacterium JC049]